MRADSEGLPERSSDRHEESAGRACERHRARHGCLGAAVAGPPAIGSLLAAAHRQHPRATQADLPLARVDRAAVGETVELIQTREAGSEPLVIGRGRPDSADGEIPRTHALGPRDPRRGDECVRAGDEHDLVDGRCLGPGSAGERDSPAPPDISRVEGCEVMGRHALVVVFDRDVVTDGAPGGLLLGGSAREVDGLGEDGVGHHSTPGAG